MKLESIWAVRDARGLTAKEKMFLLVLISRGEDGLYGKWQRNAADMGLTKRGYYDARNSLIEKNLIQFERRYDSSTIYRFDEEELSQLGNTTSHNEDDRSRSGKHHSRGDETKVNLKKNPKVNLKDNNTREAVSASASSPSLPKKGFGVKEDETDITIRKILDSGARLKGKRFVRSNAGDANLDAPNGNALDAISAEEWRKIKRIRGLTREEDDYLTEKSFTANRARAVPKKEIVQEW